MIINDLWKVNLTHDPVGEFSCVTNRPLMNLCEMNQYYLVIVPVQKVAQGGGTTHPRPL